MDIQVAHSAIPVVLEPLIKEVPIINSVPCKEGINGSGALFWNYFG